MPLEYLVDKSIDQGDPDLSGFGDNPPARLKEALDKDEFTLYCQPILALAGPDRFPMGEVLVRMREEEQAMLPPGEFLPVFEHYRMMPQLDRWVVRHIVRHLVAGSRLRCFTMNVSEQTLEDPGFPGFVHTELKSAGAPMDSLIFEIEEADVLHRQDAVTRFVAAMKIVGAGVLIDGFGRKAVSFTPLKLVGAHFVKVDGSIVRKLLKSEVARTKMDAILRVGHAIDLKVIAECVEEQDVLMRLKALGVGYAQGFGIVQPQPIDSLAS
jgi:EAL domain-containing protein (putative c-di-GMP-specific phosphodiesterase class I)